MEARTRASVAPAMESLEQRRLLSALVVGGELQVVGTHKADYIRLYVDPKLPDQLMVQVNRVVTPFPIAAFSSVNVQSGQGNDVIRLEGSAPRYAFNSRVYGSGGNDTIRGGTGVDRIYAGSGNDSIDGHFARDIIYGEHGNDSIWGYQGNDYLSGGGGNDTLIGEQGNDHHYGDAGDDYIESSDGTFDRVDGGLGLDRAKADSVLDRSFVSIETFVL